MPRFRLVPNRLLPEFGNGHNLCRILLWATATIWALCGVAGGGGVNMALAFSQNTNASNALVTAKNKHPLKQKVKVPVIWQISPKERVLQNLVTYILCNRGWRYTTQKVKDICQYLDLNTKLQAKSRKCIKHLQNFKISLTFCVVYISHYCPNTNDSLKCWQISQELPSQIGYNTILARCFHCLLPPCRASMQTVQI